MALSKVNFNSMNVTPAASKAIKFNSSNNGLETGDLGGALVLLETQTLSSAASAITFDSNIDSTYKEYIFKFIDIHPSANDTKFTINFRDGGTDYDATKTTTFFNAYHAENDGSAALGYNTAGDLSQSTGVQRVTGGTGNDNDQCASGFLHLFEPSSTTFLKHFIGRSSHSEASDFNEDSFFAGYCNTTTAIDGVQFKFDSGNIDAGTIKMYGVS